MRSIFFTYCLLFNAVAFADCETPFKLPFISLMAGDLKAEISLVNRLGIKHKDFFALDLNVPPKDTQMGGTFIEASLFDSPAEKLEGFFSSVILLNPFPVKWRSRDLPWSSDSLRTWLNEFHKDRVHFEKLNSAARIAISKWESHILSLFEKHSVKNRPWVWKFRTSRKIKKLLEYYMNGSLKHVNNIVFEDRLFRILFSIALARPYLAKRGKILMVTELISTCFLVNPRTRDSAGGFAGLIHYLPFEKIVLETLEVAFPEIQIKKSEKTKSLLWAEGEERANELGRSAVDGWVIGFSSQQ